MELAEFEVKLWNRNGMDISHLLNGKSKDGVALVWARHGPWSRPILSLTQNNMHNPPPITYIQAVYSKVSNFN